MKRPALFQEIKRANEKINDQVGPGPGTGTGTGTGVEGRAVISVKRRALYLYLVQNRVLSNIE